MLENSQYISSLDYIMENIPVLRRKDACKILFMVHDVFEDIDLNQINFQNNRDPPGEPFLQNFNWSDQSESESEGDTPAVEILSQSSELSEIDQLEMNHRLKVFKCSF